MAHHKRRRPKSTRAGCLMCKPHKRQGSTKRVHLKGRKSVVKLTDVEE